jgi:hypothetical protein
MSIYAYWLGSASLIRRLHCCEAASPQKITVHWDEICSVAKKKNKREKKEREKGRDLLIGSDPKETYRLFFIIYLCGTPLPVRNTCRGRLAWQLNKYISVTSGPFMNQE